MWTAPVIRQLRDFFNTDETKEEYNASEPVNDKTRWTGLFVHLMGHTGDYTEEQAVAAIEEHGLLPDMLSFDPTKLARYPNGRVFTDDVIDTAFLSFSRERIPAEWIVFPYRCFESVPILGHTT